MEDQEAGTLEILLGKTQSYAKTTIELSKLKGVSATANVMTMIVAKLCVLMTAMLCFIIVSIGLSIWLGGLLGTLYYGFFIIGIIYFFISLIFYFFLHKWIDKPFGNLIVTQALQ